MTFIPLDGADVFQQGEIDSIGDRVAHTQDPGDFARLAVDDARRDQVQAAAGVHLLPQLAGVDPAAPPLPYSCGFSRHATGQTLDKRKAHQPRFTEVIDPSSWSSSSCV